MKGNKKEHMKFVSLRHWVDSLDCVNYDFVQDTINDIESMRKYESINEPLAKYFLYKARLYNIEHNKCIKNDKVDTINTYLYNSKKYNTKDPDQYSVLLRQVYLHLWGYIYLNKYCICSDTMTSAQTLVNRCISCIDEIKDVWNIIYKKDLMIRRRMTTNSSIALAACNESTHLFETLNEKFPELSQFLALYHTIGNYSPIPEGFNTPRSNFGKKDFWDITLMCIQKYYLTTDTEEKKTIVSRDLLNNHTKSKPKKVIEWLEYFGDGKEGWKRYVEMNLLQDFVNENFEVIPFWDNHNINNLELPNNKNLSKALTKISELIKKRGDRIVNMIKMTDLYAFYY